MTPLYKISCIIYKPDESLSLIKAISELVYDLAEFQNKYGTSALRKLMAKLGSPYRMTNRIENLAEELKQVSYQINILSVPLLISTV